MEKKMILEQIFRKEYKGYNASVTFGDFPDWLEGTDVITINRVEDSYSENNSWDELTELNIYRPRLETDEEFEKRKKDYAELIEIQKRSRYESYLNLKYESYLKLKKEFEK